MIFSRSKNNIENLDSQPWEKLPDGSNLSKKCYKLRKKDINNFSPEDLRLLITQELSLSIVLKKALELLKNEPFIETDLLAGSLLISVLKVSEKFWDKDRELLINFVNLSRNILENIDSTFLIEDEVDQESKDEIKNLLKNFLEKYGNTNTPHSLSP